MEVVYSLALLIGTYLIEKQLLYIFRREVNFVIQARCTIVKFCLSQELGERESYISRC